MGENKKQKLITVPESNNSFVGLDFGRWDALVAKYFVEHPDSKKDNTPLPTVKREGKRNNDEKQ